MRKRFNGFPSFWVDDNVYPHQAPVGDIVDKFSKNTPSDVGLQISNMKGPRYKCNKNGPFTLHAKFVVITLAASNKSGGLMKIQGKYETLSPAQCVSVRELEKNVQKSTADNDEQNFLTVSLYPSR